MPTETQNKVKVENQNGNAPAHPLYPALSHQIGAALIVARQIEIDKSYPLPQLVKRFLDEFGRKTA